jgi:hypothetical protein
LNYFAAFTETRFNFRTLINYLTIYIYGLIILCFSFGVTHVPQALQISICLSRILVAVSPNSGAGVIILRALNFILREVLPVLTIFSVLIEEKGEKIQA